MYKMLLSDILNTVDEDIKEQSQMYEKENIENTLLSMGFTKEHTTRALKINVKNFGHKYDIDVLTEIIIRLQEKDKKRKQKKSKTKRVSLNSNKQSLPMHISVKVIINRDIFATSNIDAENDICTTFEFSIGEINLRQLKQKVPLRFLRTEHLKHFQNRNLDWYFVSCGGGHGHGRGHGQHLSTNAIAINTEQDLQSELEQCQWSNENENEDEDEEKQIVISNNSQCNKTLTLRVLFVHAITIAIAIPENGIHHSNTNTNTNYIPKTGLPKPRHLRISELKPNSLKLLYQPGPVCLPTTKQDICYYVKEYLQFPEYQFVAKYTTLTALLAPLRPRTKYKFTVYARDEKSGETSLESDPLEVTTPSNECMGAAKSKYEYNQVAAKAETYPPVINTSLDLDLDLDLEGYIETSNGSLIILEQSLVIDDFPLQSPFAWVNPDEF